MSQLPTRDDLAIPATSAEIKSAWKTILRLPITVNGNTFQFDEESEALMQKWARCADPLDTFQWRLLDNSTVTVTPAELTLIIEQCEMAQVNRGVLVDPEYLNFKTNGATRRELKQWINQHS